MGARELLDDLASAGMTIRADGDRLLVGPASRLTDDLRQAVRAAKPELLTELGARQAQAKPATPPASRPRRFRLSAEDADRCHAGGWDGAEIATFTARHARLLAFGLTDGDADDLAERLTLRDRDGDDRRLCIECSNCRGSRCRQPERAGVAAELGEVAFRLQRCPAFSPLGDAS